MAPLADMNYYCAAIPTTTQQTINQALDNINQQAQILDGLTPDNHTLASIPSNLQIVTQLIGNTLTQPGNQVLTPNNKNVTNPMATEWFVTEDNP